VSKKKYVNNYLPEFKPPKNDKNTSKNIIFIMNKIAKENKINQNILLLNKKNGNILPRYRCLNKHRVRAINAVLQAMIYHLDLESNCIKVSIEQLSDECGLSTISHSGKKSISRTSRLITEFMEPMGFIKLKKEKKSVHNFISKKILLTKSFFVLFNIEKENVKQDKTKIKNKKIKNPMLLKEIKIISHLNEKEAKRKILYSIINRYSTEELSKFGSNGLKKMVDLEYFKLHKIAKILNLNTEE
jgi:hypothetical protein